MNGILNGVCSGMCPNQNGTCPNVKPYPDGSPRSLHSEVKCKVCGDRWLWGLSWDGSMDGKFNCGHEIKEDKCEYCDSFATETIPEAESPDDFVWTRVCKNHADEIKAKNE